MGYYTYYRLDARHIKDEDQYNAIIEEMKKMELYSTEDTYGVFDASEYHEIDHDAIFKSYEEAKWYDHSFDMIKLSRIFPDVAFKLHGDGEDSGDMWNEYFKNGAYEECVARITYERPTIVEWEE